MKQGRGVRHSRKRTGYRAVKRPQAWCIFRNGENYKVYIGDSQEEKILEGLKSQAELNF